MPSSCLPPRGATASSYAERPSATTLPTVGHPSFLALTMQGPVLTWPLDALHVQQGGPAAPGQTRNGQLSLVPVTPYVAGWAAPTWTRPARGAPSATILPEGMAGRPSPQCGR